MAPSPMVRTGQSFPTAQGNRRPRIHPVFEIAGLFYGGKQQLLPQHVPPHPQRCVPQATWAHAHAPPEHPPLQT